VAGFIVTVALWVEFRPDPSVEHLFASEPIAAGEVIGTENTESVSGPADLLETAAVGAVAVSDIAKGDPVLVSAVGRPGETVPAGWWLVEVTLADGAERGASARVVLLDTGSVVDAVVARPASEDPLGADTGSVAIEPSHAAEVAAAAAIGRVAVMISSG
jgi:flagella basal body P-ring formation protein FlgA